VAAASPSGGSVRLRLDLTPRLIPFLGQADLRPTNGFVAVAVGPVVLARDIRLGETEIHRAVAWPAPPARPVVERIHAPEFIRTAWRVSVGGADPIPMCDFASAGNTWQKRTSDFRVWIPPAPPHAKVTFRRPATPTTAGAQGVTR